MNKKYTKMGFGGICKTKLFQILYCSLQEQFWVVVFASIFVYPNIEIEYLMISGTNRIKLVWLDFHSEKYNNSYVEVCVLMVIAHGLSWETFRLF